jgi:peptidoglycan/LPS O-acetylase OafA/YrhL
MILTGFSLPVLNKPDLGVDLFILLSGFLMVFQYNIRKEREDWNIPSTWLTFWVRRFFRLSPLYFCLLAVAMTAGREIYADRVLIDAFLHHTMQRPERYTDASMMNIIVHLTYVFGLVPTYAFRTPLPDWSLGLEMQFYAIFPFLVLLTRKAGWISTAIIVSVASAAIVLLVRKLGIGFPMPSFLPLKMHIFLAGMMVAAASGQRKYLYLGVAMILAAIPIGGSQGKLHFVVRELIVIGFFSLIHWHSLVFIDRVSRILSSVPFHWLGELSYGVYLLHLLILHRIAAWTIDQWGSNITDATRFIIVLAIVVPTTYGIALMTFMLIERPGQELALLWQILI